MDTRHQLCSNSTLCLTDSSGRAHVRRQSKVYKVCCKTHSAAFPVWNFANGPSCSRCWAKTQQLDSGVGALQSWQVSPGFNGPRSPGGTSQCWCKSRECRCWHWNKLMPQWNAVIRQFQTVNKKIWPWTASGEIAASRKDAALAFRCSLKMFFIWNIENCMKNYCFVLSWRLGLFLTLSQTTLLASLVKDFDSVRPQLSWWCLMWVFTARLHSNPGEPSAGAEVTNSCWHRELNTTGQTLPSEGESFLQVPQSSEKPCHRFKPIWAQEATRSSGSE